MCHCVASVKYLTFGHPIFSAKCSIQNPGIAVPILHTLVQNTRKDIRLQHIQHCYVHYLHTVTLRKVQVKQVYTVFVVCCSLFVRRSGCVWLAGDLHLCLRKSSAEAEAVALIREERLLWYLIQRQVGLHQVLG